MAKFFFAKGHKFPKNGQKFKIFLFHNVLCSQKHRKKFLWSLEPNSRNELQIPEKKNVSAKIQVRLESLPNRSLFSEHSGVFFTPPPIVFFSANRANCEPGFWRPEGPPFGIFAAEGGFSGPKGRLLRFFVHRRWPERPEGPPFGIFGRRKRPYRPEGPPFEIFWPPKASLAARSAAFWEFLAAEGFFGGPKRRFLRFMGRWKRS